MIIFPMNVFDRESMSDTCWQMHTLAIFSSPRRALKLEREVRSSPWPLFSRCKM